MTNITDYILVKDKDGQLKYFKDGQFFDIKEIENKYKQANENQQAKKKVELKPVFTYEDKPKPTAKKDLDKVFNIPQAKQELSINDLIQKKDPNDLKKTKTKKLTEKNIDKVEDKEDNQDDLPVDNELLQQRNNDQQLIMKKVEEVIAKLKIKFSDDKIQARFNNILITFFRGIRTEKEVGYMLGLPKVSGGLELANDKIEIILSVLRNGQKQVHVERIKVVEKTAQQTANKPVVDLKHRLQPPEPMIVEQKKSEPIKPIAVPEAVPQNKLKVQIAKLPKPVKTMIKPAVHRPTVKHVEEMNKPRPQVRDIRSSRTLVGPIEELQYMDLVNLRKLGKQEQEIMDSLIEKFEVLKQQSLANWLGGIKAWRSCAVFNLYLMMTYSAIKEKKKIKEVIEQKQRDNQEVLTFSEYEMIAEFNKRLDV